MTLRRKILFVYLYSGNVILIQGEIRIVTAVEGCHQGALDVAVAETERMAELVRRDLEEIRASVATHCPSLGIVEVRVAAVHREVSVRQGTARSVERIAIAVLAHLEPDLDVNLKKPARISVNIENTIR